MSNTIEGAKLEQSPYGLLGKASKVLNLADENGHWVSGFLHDILDAGIDVKNLPVRTGDPNADFDTVVQSIAGGSSVLEYSPFIVESRKAGTTFGVDPSDYKESAKEALEVSTQKSAEKEFWEGNIASLINDKFTNAGDFVHNRYAHDDDYATVLTTGAVSVKQGLSLLEEALGETTIGYQGVIHTPRRLASLAKVREYLKDGVLRTNLGTPVVAGTGYTKINDKYYMVATGPVTVVVGDIEVFPSDLTQAVNVRKNEVEYIAQRPVGVFWTTYNSFVVEIDPSQD